jgi:hypothetical protein
LALIEQTSLSAPANRDAAASRVFVDGMALSANSAGRRRALWSSRFPSRACAGALAIGNSNRSSRPFVREDGISRVLSVKSPACGRARRRDRSGASGRRRARDYKIGRADGACVIIDDTGRIALFTIGNKKLSDGGDQLKTPALARIRPPLNILCSCGSGGDVRVIADADSNVWLGPTRSSAAFAAPVTKVPVSGARRVGALVGRLRFARIGIDCRAPLCAWRTRPVTAA